MLKNFFDARAAVALRGGASRRRLAGADALVDRAAARRARAWPRPTIFNLAAYWSEFALALVLLDSQARFTMPLGLFSFQSAYETEWQLLAAASFIGLVPVMAAFVLCSDSSSPA